VHVLVEVFPEGQNTDAVRLGGLIVRRALHAQAAIALRREAAVLPHLRSLLPLPVPEPRIIEINGDVIALHPVILGQPLRSIQAFPCVLTSSIAKMLGSFLQQLHRDSTNETIRHIPCDIPRADIDWWLAFSQEVESRILPDLDGAQRDAVRAALVEHVDRMPHLPVSLIHGDFGIGNILWDGTQITGIIDFGSMRWADPSWDVAGIAAGFGIDFARQLSSGYPGLEELLPRTSFYRLAFALMEANYGAEQENLEIFSAGMSGIQRALSIRIDK
jgi:aminoglycoside 2''-phosphotransferase